MFLFSWLLKHGVRIALLLKLIASSPLAITCCCQWFNINKFNISVYFPGMTQEKIGVFYVMGMIRK